jgi:hypothetical protein
MLLRCTLCGAAVDSTQHLNHPMDHRQMDESRLRLTIDYRHLSVDLDAQRYLHLVGPVPSPRPPNFRTVDVLGVAADLIL